MRKIRNLPRAGKVAATHQLRNFDLTIKKIGQVLKISPSTVNKYLREVPDEKWMKICEDLRKVFKIKEEQLAAEALSGIEKKMPKAKFKDLVNLYRTIREVQKTSPVVAIQQNIETLTDAQVDRIIKD